MSIPPPSSGRRQPASLFARMSRFWLGGAVVFIVVAAAFVILAFMVPPTYEASALIEVTAQGAADSVALSRELRTAIVESGRIEDLARHAEPGDDPLSALDRVRQSFHVTPRSERAFSISYDARRPESALHGGEVLLDAVLEHFAHDAARHDEKQARADLEKRTRELADFVTLHPDFSPGQTGPRADASAQPSKASSVPRDDPTLTVLRQERSRLENKLAAAQAEAAQPTDKNPYEEEGDADVAGLGRQLAQVRLAIAAHQKAVSQRTEAPPAQSPEASAEAARKASLDSEWRRLVRSVVDAQSAPPPDNDTRPVRTVHVLEQPRLPSRPIKPNRPLTSVVGLLLGVAAGAVWAFSRVNLADAARKRHIALRERAAAGTTAPLQVPIAPKPEGAHPPAESTQEASDPREAIGFAATLAVPAMNEAAPGSTDAGTAPTQLAVAEPDRRALGHAQGTPEDHGPEEPGEPKKSISPAPEQRPRPGLRDMGTQRGMIDAAFVKAQTGATPESLAQRIETRPIVDVSRDRRSEPPPPADRPSTPPRSVTPPGPPSAPITQRLGSPSDPAERPSPTPSMRPSDPDKPDTSYSFVDRGWRATSKRVSSRPPSRPADRGDSAAPNAPAARSVAQRQTELRDPPIGSVHPSAATGPDDQPPHRTPPATPHAHTEAHSASNYPGATKPGWARPSPPAIAAVSEVWTKVAGPSEPVSDDVVEPRSVPPTWNKPEEAGALAPEGQLSGLCDKLIELSASSCFVVGIVGERAELQVKSQVAAALAAMLAEGTSRVLLMEANFDFPAVHRQMSVAMPNFSGFSQQMHVRTRKGDRRPWIVMRCSASLDVLAEGIVRSPGVLYSQQFAEAVSELRRYYRVIVCDGPLLGGADAKPLDAVTDGLIVVAPSQRALMNSLDRAARWFGKKQLLAAVPAVAR